MGEEKTVKSKDEGQSQRHPGSEAHQLVGRISIAGKLALVAIAIAVGALRDLLRLVHVK
jgi:hypothetical protein